MKFEIPRDPIDVLRCRVIGRVSEAVQQHDRAGQANAKQLDHRCFLPSGIMRLTRLAFRLQRFGGLSEEA
jgi:hypothetical protein